MGSAYRAPTLVLTCADSWRASRHGNAEDISATIAAVAVVGGGMTAAQCFIYGLSPDGYSHEYQGTGAGLAVALGGAVIGPLLAGAIPSCSPCGRRP